jgi:hypothetical protein
LEETAQVKAADGGTGGEAVAAWVGLERARRGWARRVGVTERVRETAEFGGAHLK